MNKGKKQSVLERFLLKNPLWEEGYRSFNLLFGKPLGFLLVLDEEANRLIRLDRRDYDSFYAASSSNQRSTEGFLIKYCELYAQEEENLKKFPCLFKDAFGKQGAIFALSHLGSLKGFLLLTALKKPQRVLESYLEPFDSFLATQVDLAFRTFELNNFYETVHPRALALSTMHSVHRVISSSLRLKELLPRIGRLSAQVLKAQGCSIMLCDPEQQYLTPYFSMGQNRKFIHLHRLKVGRGMVGRIAKTADFHFSRNSIAVPFIDEDVVGVIVLWDKIDRQPFSRTDLEILKSLSEQAVVAIKNAQLYEETEQLTLGSIKTINDLLELNFSREQSQLPVFREMILEVGKELGLSQRELMDVDRAVMLIDAGALVSPEQVWRKKGKLTKREFDVIKQIPLKGAHLLRSIKSLKPLIPIILHHRERYDGKGYPQGLKGEQIPIGARIISVVDSFLAMISPRAYREALPLEQALKEIRINRATQFDPLVVDSFLHVIHRPEMMEKVGALAIEKPGSRASASSRLRVEEKFNPLLE